MALIRMQNLFNGVSQQAKAIRLETQNEDQRNAFNSAIKGLEKRMGTEFVAKVESAIPTSLTGGDVLFHSIKRDDGEEYVGLFTPDTTEPIRLFRISDGQKMTVSYGTAADRTYCVNQPLTTDSEVRAVTIADTTIISNKNTTCAMDPTLTTAQQPFAYIWCKKTKLITGDTSITFQFVVDVTQSTGSSTSNATNDMATDVKTQLDTDLTGFTVTKAGSAGSVLKITKDDGGDFSINSSDGQGNTAVVVIKDQVEKITDLPNRADDGDIIQVVGESGLEGQGSFYVKYNFQKNKWVETLNAGLEFDIDETTMPRQMVRGAGLTFDVSTITWEAREVGDTITAPDPGFIGNTVNDIFFHKGRFGILSDENVILSKSNDFFNFWPTTATEVLDSDPIDVPHPANEVHILSRAVPFERSLILFSDRGKQFQMTSGGGLLTPKTANIDETTAYEFTDKHKPVQAGSNLYFVVETGEFSTVRELFVTTDSLTNEADDITGHVPTYIPKDIKQIISNSNKQFQAYLSYDAGEGGSLYVYNYRWEGENKILSAFNKWEFGDDREILGGEFFDNVLYLLIADTNTDGTRDLVLEKLQIDEVTNGTLGIRLHGDRLVDPAIHTVTAVASGSFPNEITTVTFPFNDKFTAGDLDWVAVHKTSGKVIQGTRTAGLDDDEVDFEGDISAEKDDYYYIKLFTFLNVLSELYMKDQKGQGVITGKLKLKKLFVSFIDSGPFKVLVTPLNRGTLTHFWTGAITGIADLMDPLSVISSREESFIVKANARGTDIRIESDSPYPLEIQAIAYLGDYNPRGQVVG